MEANNLVSKKKIRSVFLTGGRTSRKVYSAIAKNKNFYELSNINFFMGDERMLPRDSSESNYRLITETLFANGIPSNCNFIPMPSNDLDINSAIDMYENLIPNKIDLILLSWGEDGHLASIFPGEEGLFELNKAVMFVSPKLYPYDRISITPKVLRSCKSAFIFAEGNLKTQSIDDFKKTNSKKIIYPASYLKNISWFINQSPKLIAEQIILTLNNL